VVVGRSLQLWGLHVRCRRRYVAEVGHDLHRVPRRAESKQQGHHVPVPGRFCRIGGRHRAALGLQRHQRPASIGVSPPCFPQDSQLAKGVGHFANSVLPGMIDNSVLSGHRFTVFNRLGELEMGDLIYVQTLAGTFTYKFESSRIVKRSDRSVIVPTKAGTLTLTTCYPFNFLGKTTDAYIVTANLINSEIGSPN